MTTAVIGIGLIGGSLALDLKKNGFSKYIIGVDGNGDHAREALELGLVDEIATLEDAVKRSELVIVAVPVDATIPVLEEVMKLVTSQVVTDVGSTKELIVQSLTGLANRGRFVAAHPIWGTEKSGPSAAQSGGFNGRITVICDREKCDKDALQTVESMYDALGMKKIYMDAKRHDVHAAYVSHISHITSFALALSVLEKEKEVDTIFQLAGAGFESTVRLAKSSPDTWVPIFAQNRDNLLEVLTEQIDQLSLMKNLLEKEDYKKFYTLIEKANEIRKVLNRE
ncbi:MAG: prephenate dehydrogenase [Ignavibacteria bacterium]|nr:prephenate dehydrogenase [Ignavibacteria bacterium]